MRFQTKLFLDRLLGNFICFLLIPIVFVLGKIFRIDHSINSQNVKNIAVAKYYGLGTITQSVPMLKALKSKYPNAKLFFITRPQNKELVSLIPYIDTILFINDSNLFALLKTSLKLIFDLRFKYPKIDLFFDLELFSSFGVLISLFSMARNRLGFFWAKGTNFKAHIYTHLMYFNFNRPVRLSHVQLARLGGADINFPTTLLPFEIPQPAKISAHKKLDALFGAKKKKILAINVNASELSLARRWPISRFSKIAQMFLSKDICILLLGAPSEKNYTQQVIDKISDEKLKENIFNVCGYFSLTELLYLMPSFDCFLTNDTGLMNLAYAQNAKVISIYGNNLPEMVHVDNGVNIALYKPSYCSPCLYIFDSPPCKNRRVCMLNISVEDVACAVIEVINRPKPARKEDDIDCLISDDKNYLLGTLRRMKQ
ncbi:MAG: glycosyltransferase family 9 protein [Elusimicrobiota bacterium]|jgi:ADP-heptose:LPS heptosyltransferase|nr:glycosyltransferase family 9 protein [Elusimicrobiota bacterium]